MYDFAKLPNDRCLLIAINQAASRLADKLSNLAIGELSISEYNQKYLADKKHYLSTELQLYSYILTWSLAGLPTPLQNISICEYGGGTGILSMLAKEVGIGRIIYNDIYSVSCADAARIGQALGCKADEYVTGNLADLVAFFGRAGSGPDAVASYDVIEHVYDIEGFLRDLGDVSRGRLAVVMGSGANPYNYSYRRRTMKMHWEFENLDRQSDSAHKERDTLRAFTSVRREMILAVAPDLTDEQVEILVKRTRGLMKPDIETCTERYSRTGELPKNPNHPSNTCDPYTGNWQEHLMDPFELAFVLRQAGFRSTVLQGYYGCRGGARFRTVAGRATNLLISLLGKQGLQLAPFYVLHGIRD